MSPSEPNAQSDPPAAGQFLTTHWSMVVAAQDRAAPQAREALAALCRAYWYPLYAFIRRQGFEAKWPCTGSASATGNCCARRSPTSAWPSSWVGRRPSSP